MIFKEDCQDQIDQFESNYHINCGDEVIFSGKGNDIGNGFGTGVYSVGDGVGNENGEGYDFQGN